MRTFQELYQDILEQEVGKGRKITGDYNPVHMDCLLHPGAVCTGDRSGKLHILRG